MTEPFDSLIKAPLTRDELVFVGVQELWQAVGEVIKTIQRLGSPPGELEDAITYLENSGNFLNKAERMWREEVAKSARFST